MAHTFRILMFPNENIDRKDGFQPVLKINYESTLKIWGIGAGFTLIALVYFK